eukprot:scaffold15669_cov160-Amphora_coffeaeformis.AAC.1
MSSGDDNQKNSKKGWNTGETTPLVVNMSYRVVEKEDPDELYELPEPTLWASRLALFLARCLPGYGSEASLRTAWSFFEYMILPRRAAAAGDGKTRYVQAAPGRHMRTSTLYPAWTTPVRQLRDFGTGVAVYFETLLSLSVVCLVAGLLYLPSMHHYANDGYKSQHVNTVLGPMGGSLICPDPIWVPCVDCTADQWNESPGRYGTNTDGTLVFALKNTCAPLRWQEGLNHLVVMIFLAVAMYALGWYQKRLERHYDEYVLTASDFSIQIDNPPPDATDPTEWKEFFQQFGPVAYVTVALDNAELLKKLQQRRAALLKAKYIVSEDYQDKPLDSIPPLLEKRNPKLHQKLVQLEKECRNMMQNRNFPTSGVFVTFDKEADQRKCLKALQVGQLNVINNDVDALDETSYRFRGNLVLDVMEPTEPSAIRWQDLDEGYGLKIRQRILTTFLSVGVIAGGFWLVSTAYRKNDVGTAALEITLLNIIMPHVFKAINSLEAHQYEDSYQASLYWKITIFRWVNTALVTILIKPFPETLADSKGSLVASVHAVLKAEIVIAPIVHLLDIGGFVKRMILAPRAPNQSTMNACFHGAKVNLGEKYTNVTKTVFLVFFYSAIFPPGFFYGAVALFLTYITDKFLLMRSWGPMPQVRDAVAQLSRKVFFPTTVVFLAVMSEFFFSAYPCDDLCDSNTVVDATTSAAYLGSHDLALLDKTTSSVTIAAGDKIFRFCDQDFLERLPALLNFLFEEHGDWMTEAQERMSWMFGLFAGLMVGLLVFVNFREEVSNARTEVYGGFVSAETA